MNLQEWKMTSGKSDLDSLRIIENHNINKQNNFTNYIQAEEKLYLTSNLMPHHLELILNIKTPKNSFNYSYLYYIMIPSFLFLFSLSMFIFLWKRKSNLYEVKYYSEFIYEEVSLYSSIQVADCLLLAHSYRTNDLRHYS